MIECWTDALKPIVYEIRDRRSAPIVVIAMLIDLVGELANLYDGKPSPLRQLPAMRGGPSSNQKAYAQALVALHIDIRLRTGLSLQEAATLVADDLRRMRVEVLDDRLHSETPEWQRLVNLRKKISCTRPGDHVRDHYDMLSSRYGAETPESAAKIARLGLEQFAPKVS